VILLDTHAVIWLARGHKRTAPVERYARLYVSPVSLLEIQFLGEAGRLKGASTNPVLAFAAHPRWLIDEPPASKWFLAACEFEWTRDPFDRLIAAHARVRGWKLATADDVLLDHLPASDVLSL
jgi:PIN domain nuclease of toxin-antitoxin system